jgi:hypothetical protein
MSGFEVQTRGAKVAIVKFEANKNGISITVATPKGAPLKVARIAP